MNHKPPTSGVPTEFTVDLTEEDYESVSMAVVRVVAEHIGVQPEYMDPLAESINTDALDGLFDSRSPDPAANLEEITFHYQGVMISITGDRKLHYRPPQPVILGP